MSVFGHTLPKSERLSGRSAIGELLREGRYITSGCLKVCFKAGSADATRIMVSVPKKLFKRAVKRNAVKRRVRESYRTQKSLLGRPVDILFIYNNAEVLPSEVIFKAVGDALKHISEK
ncbi:MAG: ribonuclease P protein component [Bacteroidales bacterium]|nr:ribonuclease P protein component [Bacteroidales bacterium]